MTNQMKPMQEVSVEEIVRRYNLIVPEIQREYVWGFNQYGIFETFLEDLKEGFKKESELPLEAKSLKDAINSPGIAEVTKKGLEVLFETMTNSFGTMNIGFLYSYKPSYYIGNDREEDLYLIDGQQRFTTLFLLLLYFSLKENRKTDFVQLFKFDQYTERIAFDYRVRSITHQFFIELISRSETVRDLLEISKKQWFLEKYRNDVTVSSVTGVVPDAGVFHLINQHFGKETDLYFSYIVKNVKFWHFQTEETSQGEELYITMNSRGQQLADNETIRAKLFDSDDVKNNPLLWSEKWEIWQDFFWKNRLKTKPGISADEGFNEFLRWVQILKMWDRFYKDKTPLIGDRSKFEQAIQWQKGLKLDINCLSLVDIDNTFKALQFLYINLKTFNQQFISVYPRSHNDDMIPKEWICHDGNPIPLINLFQLLPLLNYCKGCIERQENINEKNVYRLSRILKSLSKDKAIAKAIRDQISNALSFADNIPANKDVVDVVNSTNISKMMLVEELTTKLELIKNSAERERLEDLIWYAEDFRINAGEVLHLIHFAKSSTDSVEFEVNHFEKVVLTFKEFMDNQELMTGDIVSSDCYNDFWDRVTFDNAWYKKSGILKLIKERLAVPLISFSEFLRRQQKHFVKQYQSVDELLSETDPKKQIYIYYILTVNNIAFSFLSWNWDSCFNFGKLDEGYHKSLFRTGKLFQLFRSSFVQNSERMLEIHTFGKDDAFKKLLKWAQA